METKTKLDITPMLNLVPAILPEGKERNAIMQNARMVGHKTLLAWEAENGSQYPKYLSYRLTQALDSLVQLGYKYSSKWNDLVEIYFGETLTGKWDASDYATRLVVRYEDMNIEKAREALASEYPNEYEHFRKENTGATHAEAMQFIATAHFHYYTWETFGKRNHVLGTHDLRTVFTCECGHSYETRSVNNYSGD
jgi:hypothetical protein